jgi:hypothetical protein
LKPLRITVEKALNRIGNVLWLLMRIMKTAIYPEGEQSPILLVCGHIWDGQADEPFGPTELLVEDGKIAQIGKIIFK